MFHVNQSVFEKLKVYEQMLHKWQKSMNLVAPSTLADAWVRHFEDSMQLAPHMHGAKVLVDVGSGAGFPGLVLAVCLPDTKVHLIESDGKKAAFLSAVSREIGLENANIHLGRIEKNLPALRADIVSARALASLRSLLQLTKSQWERDEAPACLLFPKGADFAKEIAEAEESYEFELKIEPSRTDKDARILCISNVRTRRVA